mgnify:CR=1 FL=1
MIALAFALPSLLGLSILGFLLVLGLVLSIRRPKAGGILLAITALFVLVGIRIHSVDPDNGLLLNIGVAPFILLFHPLMVLPREWIVGISPSTLTIISILITLAFSILGSIYGIRAILKLRRS